MPPTWTSKAAVWPTTPRSDGGFLYISSGGLARGGRHWLSDESLTGGGLAVTALFKCFHAPQTGLFCSNKILGSFWTYNWWESKFTTCRVGAPRGRYT